MPNRKYIYGVDIGATSVKLGFFTESEQLLEKWQLPSRTDGDSAAMFFEIVQSLQKNMAANSVRQTDIIGMGVGVPGTVDGFGAVHGSVNLGWKTVAIKDALESLCQFSVRVENDANAAALGEFWQGAAKGYDSIAMLTLGTGVGGALILDGKLQKGANGCAGEVGHICVRHDETLHCGCGACGCLEQYASATGLVRLAKQEAMSAKSTLMTPDSLSAKSVFEAAQAGDAAALAAVDCMAEMLGRALNCIAVVCDPQVFIIGGGVSAAGEFLRESICHHYRGMAFGAAGNSDIKIALLKNDAGIWGAADLFLKAGQC